MKGIWGTKLRIWGFDFFVSGKWEYSKKEAAGGDGGPGMEMIIVVKSVATSFLE